MKTKVFALILASVNLFLFSCNINDTHVIPDSKVTTRQATFSGYDMIDASTAFSVFVTFSDTEESIEIEANDNLHKHIVVEKVGGVLKIGLEHAVNVRGSATLNAYITTKHVSGYMASGASRLLVESPINSDEASIYLSGASTFSGALEVNKLNVDLSGASIMNIEGYTNVFEVEASGASVIRDYGFDSNTLIADLSGASNIYVTVDEDIDVEASGASILRYKGSAVIKRQDLSGASVVKKMN
jgi:hypothetical protein